MGAVLVVGATRILAPAVESLSRRARDVVAVARDASALKELRARCQSGSGRVETFAADARQFGFVDLVGSAHPLPDAAIVYGPASSDQVVDALCDEVDGPVIEILTSVVAAPTDRGDWSLARLPVAPPNRHRIVLGWSNDPSGSRWHTASEISAAAVATLADPRDHVLGVLRPWSLRPA